MMPAGPRVDEAQALVQRILALPYDAVTLLTVKLAGEVDPDRLRLHLDTVEQLVRDES